MIEMINHGNLLEQLRLPDFASWNNNENQYVIGVFVNNSNIKTQAQEVGRDIEKQMKQIINEANKPSRAPRPTKPESELKTPSYVRRAHKTYYDKKVKDPLFIEMRRAKDKARYEKKKELKALQAQQQTQPKEEIQMS